MTDKKGQMQIGAVISIVILLVSIAIGGIMYSRISQVAKDQAGGDDAGVLTTNNANFSDSTAWTLENTKPLAISHNSTDEWVDITSTATSASSGTATVLQSLDIDYQGGVEDASMEAAYHTENADNLSGENMHLRLIDPDGNVEIETTLISGSSTTVAWASASTDVTDAIDEEGTWEVRVFTEATVDGTGFESNVDNVQLDVDTKTIGESTKEEADSGASTVFPLMVLIVIVGVFVMIIGVLRQLG